MGEGSFKVGWMQNGLDPQIESKLLGMTPAGSEREIAQRCRELGREHKRPRDCGGDHADGPFDLDRYVAATVRDGAHGGADVGVRGGVVRRIDAPRRVLPPEDGASRTRFFLLC